MKFTFLGTGTSQGVPVIGCQCAVCKSADKHDKRLRTSALIQSDETTLVIDTGPDFRQQMLREDIRELDAVVFTHQHKDHVAGLDDIRAYNFLLQRPIHLWANEITENQIRQEFSYIFADKKYPGIPEVVMHRIPEEDFTIGDIRLTPLPLFHYKLPVLGFRIKNLVYITDANVIPEESWKKIEGAQILVLNALRKEAHISHFNLEEALNIVETLKPEQAYFTHISHLMGRHADINRELPENVELARDGLSFEF